MFKQAVIHHPEDEKAVKKIKKDIAAFYCAAVIKYMDSLNMDDKQKTAVIDDLLKNDIIRQKAKTTEI